MFTLDTGKNSNADFPSPVLLYSLMDMSYTNGIPSLMAIVLSDVVLSLIASVEVGMCTRE